MNLTVAAKTPCPHRHRFDHGANLPTRAPGINLGQATPKKRHIGRRAADVGNQRILHAGQPARAHDTGGGA